MVPSEDMPTRARLTVAKGRFASLLQAAHVGRFEQIVAHRPLDAVRRLRSANEKIGLFRVFDDKVAEHVVEDLRRRAKAGTTGPIVAAELPGDEDWDPWLKVLGDTLDEETIGG